MQDSELLWYREAMSDSTTSARADVSRRSFMAAAGLSTTTLMVERLFGRGAMAGPFAELQPGAFPVPADKKLDPAWVRSLTARGTPTVYTSSRDELKWIGMPIGGVCCGQVYLGGDGRLWHWDIFNLPQERVWGSTEGPLYPKPATPRSPMEQGFALRVKAGGAESARRLDASGFKAIEFTGQYPVGHVEYRDDDAPVSVALDAYSPFVPLDFASSSLPLTVMSFTVRNTSGAPVDATVAGWLQNPVLLATERSSTVRARNRVVRSGGLTMVACSAEAVPEQDRGAIKPDVVFEDWEKGTYEGWTATGTAFGDTPRNRKDIAGYQGNVNAQGEWTVNTHESRHGEDVVKADQHIGTLTSREFVIDRAFIRFRIGGGNRPGQECMNLLIDGAPVRTATGRDNNRMRIDHFDVREFAGRTARLQIVDAWTGGWGQIGIDEIVVTDSPETDLRPIAERPDFGTMLIGAVDPQGRATGAAAIGAIKDLRAVFGPGDAEATAGLEARPIGSVSRSATIAPGASETFTFLVAWHFPTPNRDELAFLTGIQGLRHHYASRFKDAMDVAAFAAKNLASLSARTKLWRDTWVDSTLPHWFLDRTFINTSIAATVTCLRFDNGRFYGWEGTHCCAGTCQHVWQYAQGLARVFPELERSAREMVDYGLAFHEDTGAIDYRAEADRRVAHDGLAGTIMRAYREHQMSVDDAFLKRIWPRVKKSVEYLMREDKDGDGLLEGEQYNTLDAAWYGPMGWISSLYLGAVRAGEAMARDVGDEEFARRCAAVCERGSISMVEKLYNGEYFIHLADPKHPEANSTNDGCHIDQVFGQSWAWQVGLDRVIPERECKSALASLWKYSFAPDVGVYRDALKDIIKGGRWYAMPGEAGLLMCTFPKGGADRATAKGGDAWAAGYFNECMHGFEYQVASHMVWEGLVTEGMAITRSLEDRYHASKRNPYNEIECSNHYARSMASYGVFLAACGFEHHGPRGHIGFAPRVSPNDFRAPFTSCEGWGTFSQKREGGKVRAEIAVREGQLRVSTLALSANTQGEVTAMKDGARIAVDSVRRAGDRIVVRFEPPVVIDAGRSLQVTLV